VLPQGATTPLNADLYTALQPSREGEGQATNFAAIMRLRDGASYALMANTLSPEFTPDRVKIGAGPDWLKRFTNSAPWATPAALRELIGPNWMPQ